MRYGRTLRRMRRRNSERARLNRLIENTTDEFSLELRAGEFVHVEPGNVLVQTKVVLHIDRQGHELLLLGEADIGDLRDFLNKHFPPPENKT